MVEGAASVVVSHSCCGTQLSLSLLLLLPLQPCKAMRELAAARGVKLLLPQDAVVAYNLDDDQGCCTVPLTAHCCTPEAPCVPNGEPSLTIFGLYWIQLFTPLMTRVWLWDDDQGCCTVPLTAHCCTPDAPCVPNGEPPMMKLALRVIVTNDTLVTPVMITIFITATPITLILIIMKINDDNKSNNT
jgi:hypothetical protein